MPVLLVAVLLAASAAGQENAREVFAFSADFGKPRAPLVVAADGNLYGTLSQGGVAGFGSIFRVAPSGAVTRVATFNGINGASPDAGLLQTADGQFYGTASTGGAHGFGTIYRLTPAGDLAAVASFSGPDGKFPEAELVQAADGAFYGTTSAGGASDLGTIFKFTPAGGIVTLVSFVGANGAHPYAKLTPAGDGNLYGTTRDGGSSDAGTLFNVSPSGTLTTLVSFAGGAQGAHPYAGLLAAADGNFYGTTAGNGASCSGTDCGTVFRMTQAGALTTLAVLNSINSNALAAFITATNGKLYTTVVTKGLLGPGIIEVTPASGSVRFFSPLHVVLSSTPDLVAVSEAELIQKPDGYFYGTTVDGTRDVYGGTVFRFSLEPQGFDPPDAGIVAAFGMTAVAYPKAGVIQGADGALYGVATRGNRLDGGAIFKLAAGSLSTFITPTAPSIVNPETELLQRADGSVYGTSAPYPIAPTASVFALKADGSVTSVVSLGQSESYDPSGLVTGPDGNLFFVTRRSVGIPCHLCTATRETRFFRLVPATGAVSSIEISGATGGLVDGGDGFLYGTRVSAGLARVFKASVSGVVSDVATIPSGSPQAPLLRGGDGALYGTTTGDGPAGAGTIFRVTPTGEFTTLASFNGTNGAQPYGRLLDGGDGFLYGTTVDGGANGLGTVFKVTTAGAVTTLVHFNGTNGAHPYGALMRASDGLIYGTASQGCSLRGGCIFRLSAAEMTVAPASLRFGALTNAGGFVSQTGPQTVRMSQSGVGTVTWTAAATQPWLTVTPSAGAGPATFTVSVSHVAGMQPVGSLEASVSITLSGADSATLSIPVILQLVTNGASAAPFGLVDTPLEGATGLSGSIGVTGWALDDVRVSSLAVCRAGVAGETPPPDGRCGAGQVFIGAGTFVRGARPDVEAAFPASPNAARAGWGLIVLTNMLPFGGNGSYQLFAYAGDDDGHVVLLGARTIGADNAHATAPFGAIDTPDQGGTVSGISNNFGWVLAKAPRRADPPFGAVTVLIDGLPVGSPSGWTSRSDLSALFSAAAYPGISRALGVFSFDSRLLADGVHTIAWTVTDDGGAAAGIGSRYFIVANGSGSAVALGRQMPANQDLAGSIARDTSPMLVRTGFDLEAPFREVLEQDGVFAVEERPLGRIEWAGLTGSGSRFEGYIQSGNRRLPLPMGSSIDPETGAFVWQPGVAFVGDYQLVIVRTGPGGSLAERRVRVRLLAR